MSMPSLALKPSEARSAIVRALKANLVPLVRSSPGIGKSDIVRDIAKQFHLKLIDLRLSQADITDLNGLPNFVDGRAEYCPFTDFPLAGDPLPPMLDENGNPVKDANGETVYYRGWLLFCDELTSAPKQIQAASYKLLLDRTVGQKMLHPACALAAAGNLESDNAVVHGMSTALQSRLIHLEMRVDKDEWIAWAIKNNVDYRILAFIEFQPGKLYEFKPDHTDKTFACPRTWRFADKLINGVPELTTKEDLPLLSGALSQGVAHQFIEFCGIYGSLPKLSEIVKDPATCRVPTEMSTRFAMAMFVAEQIDNSNADPLMTYLNRIPGVESKVLALRTIRARKAGMIRHAKVSEMMQTFLDKMKKTA